jgi:hypothetical protein
MDPVRNPFSPGAGTPPPAFIGRNALLRKADVALQRIQLGRSARSLILVGLRGVGKTVLLFRIREQAAAAGYKAIMLETPENKSLAELLFAPLRQILLSLDAMENISTKAKRGLRVLKSFASGLKVRIGEVELGIDAELGSADSGDLESDLGNLFEAVGEAAADRKTAVALCIDELQYLRETDLSALIMAVHRVAQKQLPLVVFGAGLPQIVATAGRSKSYAERLFEFPDIGALTSAEAREALTGPVGQEQVTFTEGALEEIVRVTEGYPYFLQQWGYEVWNTAKVSPIDLATVRAASHLVVEGLDESFFRVRFDRLTPREKAYLRAMAEGGPRPQRSGDIAEQMGVKVTSVAPVRNSLIKKGMLYSPAHGENAFTVPLFDQYMIRVMPLWPEPRDRP